MRRKSSEVASGTPQEGTPVRQVSHSSQRRLLTEATNRRTSRTGNKLNTSGSIVAFPRFPVLNGNYNLAFPVPLQRNHNSLDNRSLYSDKNCAPSCCQSDPCSDQSGVSFVTQSNAVTGKGTMKVF